MSEFPKPSEMNRQQRSRAERVSEVIHMFTDHVRHEGLSDYPKHPELHTGFNAMGDYVQDPTPGGRWNDMGNYTVDL